MESSFPPLDAWYTQIWFERAQNIYFFCIEFHFFFLQAIFKTDTSFWRIFYNESQMLWDTLYIVD
jgi:hypothetical protein